MLKNISNKWSKILIRKGINIVDGQDNRARIIEGNMYFTNIYISTKACFFELSSTPPWIFCKISLICFRRSQKGWESRHSNPWFPFVNFVNHFHFSNWERTIKNTTPPNFAKPKLFFHWKYFLTKKTYLHQNKLTKPKVSFWASSHMSDFTPSYEELNNLDLTT